MKVLHVTPAYLPNAGGIESLLASLLPVLQSQLQSDIHLAVASPNIWDSEFEHLGIAHSIEERINVWRFGKIGSTHGSELQKHLEVSAAVRRLMESQSISLVHIHGPSRLAYPAFRVARASAIPTVLHLHGSIEPNFSAGFMSMCCDSDSVIAPSRFVADSAMAATKRKMPIHVLPNGVIGSERNKVKVEDSKNLVSVKLVCAGRLEKNKGFDLAIMAVGALMAKGVDVSLEVFGKGPERDQLERIVEALRLGSRVKIRDPISHEQLMLKFAESDFVIVPSRTFEGFSMVAAEAASLGRICIATRVGGLPETVINGNTGIIVEEEDFYAIAESIERLLANPTLRKQIEKNALSHARGNLSLENMSLKLIKLYLEVTLGVQK